MSQRPRGFIGAPCTACRGDSFGDHYDFESYTGDPVFRLDAPPPMESLQAVWYPCCKMPDCIQWLIAMSEAQSLPHQREQLLTEHRENVRRFALEQGRTLTEEELTQLAEELKPAGQIPPPADIRRPFPTRTRTWGPREREAAKRSNREEIP